MIPSGHTCFNVRLGEIRSILADRAMCIEHIGPTSVPTLAAEPTIDILIVVTDSAEESAYAPVLEQVGYQLHIREPGWHEHRMFKGLDSHINLHVFSDRCSEIDRILAFRDLLRTYKTDRELYARAKRELAQKDWKYMRTTLTPKLP